MAEKTPLWRKHPLWNAPRTDKRQPGGPNNPKNVHNFRACELIEGAINLTWTGWSDGRLADDYAYHWPWQYSIPNQGVLCEMLDALKMTQSEFVRNTDHTFGLQSVGMADHFRKYVKSITERDRRVIPSLVIRCELPIKLYDFLKNLSRDDTKYLVVGNQESESCPWRESWKWIYTDPPKPLVKESLSKVDHLIKCLAWLENRSDEISAPNPKRGAKTITLAWLGILHPDVFLDKRSDGTEAILQAAVLSSEGDTVISARHQQTREVLNWLRWEWLELLKKPPKEIKRILAEASRLDNPIWNLIHKPSARAVRDAHSWACWKLNSHEFRLKGIEIPDGLITAKQVFERYGVPIQTIHTWQECKTAKKHEPTNEVLFKVECVEERCLAWTERTKNKIPHNR
ncbi:MAG TPA: hypothetical protein VKX17_22530 [Planctomycetota bacterium]|nr:hypothetical protein [Planctomycetota bacterium]